MKLSRRIATAALGATTGLGGLAFGAVVMAPSAHAAVRNAVKNAPEATCSKATGTANSKTGLTGTKKSISITGTMKASGCKGVKGQTSGTATYTLKGKMSCTAGSATGTIRIKTNTGKIATGTLKLAATSTPLEYKITGVSTGGAFGKGSKISGTFKATPVTGNCFSKPLKKATVKNVGSFKL